MRRKIRIESWAGDNGFDVDREALDLNRFAVGFSTVDPDDYPVNRK
jgi:hypothetical protein